MNDLSERIQIAVENFWSVRNAQAQQQSQRGHTDQGARGSVTGGKQMDGFISITLDILHDCGIRDNEIFHETSLELPGYYRPEKQWDVVVVANNKLIAALEFKSQASSFGNNFNNRVEEAIGSATDLWTAYREGVIPTNPRPWIGYVMLLVKSKQSMIPVKVREPHFDVFPEFRNASYADRYRALLTKLMRERLYEATSLIMTSNQDRRISYSEPEANLSFKLLIESLRAAATMFHKIRT
jgi:restriction endonuclease XhoI-like protein